MENPMDADEFRELVERSAQGVLIQVAGKPVYANFALARMLGYAHPRELVQLESIFEIVDSREQPRVRRIVARRQSDGDAPDVYVFRARRRDGRLVWLENRVNAVTWGGEPALQCTLMDVSDRQRATNALRLAARVASKAGRKESFADAIEVALKWLARGLGWDLAESWLPSAAGDVLEPGPVWCGDKARFKRFLASSRDYPFKRGEGLPGRVLETGSPQWMEHIAGTGTYFRRSIAANQSGLTTGCGIPITAQGRTIAVLCFFATESRPEDTALISALTAGTSSLGPVLQQIQTEQARRVGIEQTETLITRNADGILVVDDDDRVLFANPAAENAFGRSLRALSGMPFGTPSMEGESAEIEIRNARDGRLRLNEMRVAEVDWQGRPARLVSLRDVTDRYEAQLALKRHREALQERVKELQCLYAVSAQLARNDMSWQQVLNAVVQAIPQGMQYPGTACARLKLEEEDVSTPFFRETEWHIGREISIDEEILGRLDVYYMEAQGNIEHSPFLHEEENLLDEISRRIAQSVSTRRYQQELDLNRRRFQDFAEAASDWLWEMDENLRFTYFSDRIESVMGQPAHRWIGHGRQELTAENQNDPKWVQHRADLEARRAFRDFRYEIALPDGSTRHISISGVPVYDTDGKFRGYRGSGTDETKEVEARGLARESEQRLHRHRKQAEAQIQYLGYHDQLTGLPNRELFIERVNQVLPIASRNGSPVAVAMLGLNRFKQVNEEFGMAGGDQILRDAARRFEDCLRPGDTLARFGGDRFLLLLPSVGTDPATHKPLGRLVAAMERPFTIEDRQIVLRFNMGIAVFPDHGELPETLVQRADSAQVHYNRWGPGFGYTFYQDRMPDSDPSNLALEKDLRDAINREGELEAYFQPIFTAGSGQLVAVETLARWNHPERGMISPVEFIPLAEGTGLIASLGLKILRQACARVRALDKAGLCSVILNVNLSAKQIRDPELSGAVRGIIEETGMPPERLVLEVTETSLIADLVNASQFMEELGTYGVQFALDDFGVGYSSLSYLGRLPVQTLKIDRSFVRDLQPGSRGEATIKGIVALAHALGLHVIAEGIETSTQLEHVARLGCDTAQGFYLARPMPARELEAMLAREE